MTSIGEKAPIPSLREALGNFWRLIILVRPYWRLLTKSVALGLLLTLAGLIAPYFSKLLFDEVYPTRDVNLLHVVVAFSAALGVLNGVGGTIRSYFSAVVGARLSSAMSLMFFNHLQHLTVRFFDEHRVGELMSRFQDVRSSVGVISRFLGVVLSTGLYCLVIPPLLMLLDWRLAPVALATTPITLAITLTSSRFLRRLWKTSAEAQADLSAIHFESLTQIRNVKALALEPYIYERTRSQTEQAMRLSLRATGLG
jgi:ABC-type bacteriocin/lantibiotic exporter with double-glycine peptidase domain